ncbi:hypothetical protein [Bacillus pinisoli]|uniref:UPF0738 family protein n=1 Tax=Bacillus pinisoli TaxID=2901866 RepID=UPI001FF0E622|nr:hypothetical protein [Bacillus pinisoli]
MQKRISIERAEWNDGQLKLIAHPTNFEKGTLSAAERVLVDSDQLAFIYILENNEEYVYLALSSPFWPELKKALADDASVQLVMNELELELIGLKDELEYLIQNIQGNANYGSDMEKEVEKVFFT